MHKEKDRKTKQDYYIHCIINAFFNTGKASSFQQITKNHLQTSIDFLSFVKKNKRIIPSKCRTINIPNSIRPTLVFDLD